MAAAKKSTSKANTTGKKLTIEFAGICTLVWNKKAGTGTVQLVDLGSAGFQRHYAALGIPVSEDKSVKSLRGPDADAAISLIGADVDMGVWNLLGTDVEIVGGIGKLAVDDEPADVTRKPAKSASSVRWLPDISALTESSTLDPVCPTAATIGLTAGSVFSIGGERAKKVQFMVGETPIGPARYCIPRFAAVIPFESELVMRLDRQRVLRFTDSRQVVISNTCVCGLGEEEPPDHFYAHYDVVKAKRRPTIQSAGNLPKFPSFPEFCWPGLVETTTGG